MTARTSPLGSHSSLPCPSPGARCRWGPRSALETPASPGADPSSARSEPGRTDLEEPPQVSRGVSAQRRARAGTAARTARPKPPGGTERRFRLPAAGSPSRGGAGAVPEAGGGEVAAVWGDAACAAPRPGIPVPAILNLRGGTRVTRRRLAALHRIRQCRAGER